MTLIDRFEAQYIPEPNCGCWLWVGADRSGSRDDGYGQIVVDGKKCAAHRVAWELFRGPIPDGLFALHRCDVMPCVNPDHLFLGTRSDNMRDMTRKGRGRGAALMKIPPEIVQAVREAEGSSYEIGQRFGIGPGYVRDLRLGTRRAVL